MRTKGGGLKIQMAAGPEAQKKQKKGVKKSSKRSSMGGALSSRGVGFCYKGALKLERKRQAY